MLSSRCLCRQLAVLWGRVCVMLLSWMVMGAGEAERKLNMLTT
jgi:hypothetical protein